MTRVRQSSRILQVFFLNKGGSNQLLGQDSYLVIFLNHWSQRNVDIWLSFQEILELRSIHFLGPQGDINPASITVARPGLLAELCELSANSGGVASESSGDWNPSHLKWYVSNIILGWWGFATSWGVFWGDLEPKYRSNFFCSQCFPRLDLSFGRGFTNYYCIWLEGQWFTPWYVRFIIRCREEVPNHRSVNSYAQYCWWITTQIFRNITREDELTNTHRIYVLYIFLHVGK